MIDLSKKGLQANCPHCDPNSFALKHPLKKTKDFWVVCDVHPISKGHILIIPKVHLSCIGEYPANIYNEFLGLYREFSRFVLTQYGSVSSFEHGKIGQTVFHSHVHLIAFRGDPLEIIPEGMDKLTKLKNLSELKTIYQKDGAYLFFSIGDTFWIVDTNLATPGFFRDRFAKALGNAKRGNWRKMRADNQLMAEVKKDVSQLEQTWFEYHALHK